MAKRRKTEAEWAAYVVLETTIMEEVRRASYDSPDLKRWVALQWERDVMRQALREAEPDEWKRACRAGRNVFPNYAMLKKRGSIRKSIRAHANGTELIGEMQKVFFCTSLN